MLARAAHGGEPFPGVGGVKGAAAAAGAAAAVALGGVAVAGVRRVVAEAAEGGRRARRGGEGRHLSITAPAAAAFRPRHHPRVVRESAVVRRARSENRHAGVVGHAAAVATVACAAAAVGRPAVEGLFFILPAAAARAAAAELGEGVLEKERKDALPEAADHGRVVAPAAANATAAPAVAAAGAEPLP